MTDRPQPDRERWRRIEIAFDAAYRAGPSSWGATLDRVCADDTELRAEVEALLQSTAGADEVLGRIARGAGLDFAGATGSFAAGGAVEGRRVGAYRLLSEIGRGGMGAVYLAERADDAFEKRVAIKLLPLGMDTAAAQARFRAERQILAGLEHPGIARLLDGGLADDGTPYFVMEHVEGEPLTAWCARRGLGVEARLRLFLQVCDAVDHAHRKLVVHRDIKPANILVRPDGQAVLLDFGIAQTLHPEAADSRTVLAATAGWPVTLAYASPEQLRGDPISTATDVYALGVVLYELLAGRTPFTVSEVSGALAEGRVGQAMPAPPSAAATVAPAERTRDRALHPDLDAIALRALQPEPERRYRSAAALGDDVRRFLEHRPVSAQPDRWRYRTRTFARRRPAVVATAAVAVLAVAAFTTTLAISAQRLERERREAELQRDRARLEAARAGTVSDFLVGLFEAADPAVARGADITASELLERGVAQARDLNGAPAVRAELMTALARVYSALGRYGDGLPLAEEALALRRETAGPVHADIAAALRAVGDIEHSRGNPRAADRYFQEALTLYRALLGESHPLVASTMVRAARVRHALHYATAEPEAMLRRALEIQRAQAEPNAGDMLVTVQALAELLLRDRRPEEAEPFRAESVRLRLALLGPEHPEAVNARLELGHLLRQRGDSAGAAEQYRQALALQEQLGPHPRLAAVHMALASASEGAGDAAGAEAHLRRALAVASWFREQNPGGVYAPVIELADLLQRTNRLEEAEPLYRRAIEATHGPAAAVSAAGIRLRLAHLLRNLGRLDEAVALGSAAVAGYQAAYDVDSPVTARALTELAMLLHAAGRLDAAERRSREAVALYRRLLADEQELPFRGARDVVPPPEERRAPDAFQLAGMRFQLRRSMAVALDARAAVLQTTGRLEESTVHAAEAVALWDGIEGEFGRTPPEADASRARLTGLVEAVSRDRATPRR